MKRYLKRSAINCNDLANMMEDQQAFEYPSKKRRQGCIGPPPPTTVVPSASFFALEAVANPATAALQASFEVDSTGSSYVNDFLFDFDGENSSAPSCSLQRLENYQTRDCSTVIHTVF
jgi:hypothetical protein